MALFEIHKQEEMEIGLWTKSVEQGINSYIHIKSSQYDFDFIKGNPSGRSKRFEWVYPNHDFYYDVKDPSTKPSFNTHIEDISEILNSSESLLDIPDIEL